ncbi:MAG: AMP-binding protein [Acidimicrobiia bacterium]|nr:AMP-binding protein [Acidimicrobiia bacterium]
MIADQERGRETLSSGDAGWNVSALLERRALEAPTATTLLFQGRTWTFGELADQAAELAGRLEAAGLARGQAVAVCLPNSPELVLSFFAAWWLGAVVVPMNPTLTEREIAHALEDSGASVVVTTGEVARHNHPDRVVGADHVFVVSGDPPGDGSGHVLPPARRHPPVAAVEPESPAVVMFTSGTTGRSKGAVLTWRAVSEANATLGVALKGSAGPYPVSAKRNEPTMIVLPLTHVAGLTSLLFALYAGRSVLLMERFRVEPFVEEARRHRVHTFVATPAMLQMLAKHEHEIELPSLRFVHSTGAALPLTVKAQFERRYGVPIFQNYGQTETLHVAGWTRDDLRSGRWKPGAVGRAYEGVELRIVDDEGDDLPAGEPGELLVRSRHTMQRYIGQAAGSEAPLDAEGWLHTGDIGFLDEDGDLFLVDRKREVIIAGGFNVYPAEVENVLLEHPGIREVVVVGLPDDRLGEVPHAFVVPMSSPGPAEAELVEFCRDRIAHYKAVRGVTLVDSLPRTESQKIRRQQVKAMALEKVSGTGPVHGE